ncbi:MAG: metallophosphoesterase [Methyloceanibacter sp.]
MSAESPPDTVKYPQDLDDRAEYPGMVRWFSPLVLVKIARKAIDAALFGQDADRRLIHAALDIASDDDIKSRCDFSTLLKRGPDGAVWIDYVADLGDGFDSTYAIAYLLGQKSLKIEGVDAALPRGQALIMGGDQVYPDATRADYKKRFLRPYAFAFPDTTEEGADHPPLFLIPGNHDWYDGLVLFLAMFCRGRETKVGSWRAGEHQRRSYFAISLPDNWWIWGFDSQLGEDIDEPQARYFVSVARNCMGESPKIIICAPVPTWLRAELTAKNAAEREKFYRGLNYMALDIASKNCKDPRICAVLSGDLHHYSRYSSHPVGRGAAPKDPASSCQFITAGGGGAFLHPTHQLGESMKMGWTGRTHDLSLETTPGEEHKPAPGAPACYPDRRTSRLLLFRNLGFPVVNFSFCLALGAVYWLIAMLLMVWQGDALLHPAAHGRQWAGAIFRSIAASPMLWFIFPVLVAALWKYADARTAAGRWALGIGHAAVHMAIILALVSLLPLANAWILAHTPLGGWLPGWFMPSTLSFFFLFAIEMILIGGILGGIVWGLYLLLTCGIAGIHDNDAFSAMRLGRYRHFLQHA